MKEKGVDALDAPVSGGQAGAESGSLSIMAGGSEEAFGRAKPLFEVMGKSYKLIGEAGAGQITKACNQMIVGMTLLGVSFPAVTQDHSANKSGGRRDIVVCKTPHSSIRHQLMQDLIPLFPVHG